MTANNERTKDELEKMTLNNDKLIKDNGVLDDKNTKLDADIVMLIERVDVNTLLKEVDMEELKLLAKNTEDMNYNFINMLQRWEVINKMASDKVGAQWNPTATVLKRPC